METILGNALNKYAQRNAIDLSTATVRLLEPRLDVAMGMDAFQFEYLRTDIESTNVVTFEIALPGANTQYALVSLDDITTVLQKISSEMSIEDWISQNLDLCYTDEQLKHRDDYKSLRGYHLIQDSFSTNELCRGTSSDISSKINEHYAAEAQKYYKDARGETTADGIAVSSLGRGDCGEPAEDINLTMIFSC
jgi:hypothetical protein